MEKFETPYVAITDAIASHAKWRTDRTALVCGNQRVTWREFDQAINRVANGLLKGGLRKGDKVSVLMLNSIEMLEIMMGTIKAGGVIVPLSVMLTAESLASMINDSDSQFIFVGAPFARVIDSMRRDLPHISSESFFVVDDDTEGWNDYRKWRDEVMDRRQKCS